MKNKEVSQTEENLQKLINKAIKKWKIIEEGCKSAYFISNPKSQLDKLLNESK